jgi:CopG family nickel-responsive transcriptional regulator
MVYDHHQSGLAQRLTEIQHEAHEAVLSSLHCHLDHYNCLEVLVLRGEAEVIKHLGQRLISTKGVKHGQLNLTTTGKDLF